MGGNIDNYSGLTLWEKYHEYDNILYDRVENRKMKVIHFLQFAYD